MAFRIQTATDFYLYPPRASDQATNRMHTVIVTTISASASQQYYMFPIPNDCMVVGGGITASVPSGTIGNTILQVGWGNGSAAANETAFGVFTLSGTAVLSTKFSSLVHPATVSSSGADAQTACIITVLSVTTSTTSLSIYLLLEYVMPGTLN